MRLCTAFFVLFFSITFSTFTTHASDSEKEFCKSSREYITTLEFLRKNQKKFGIEEEKSREVALQISSNCTGAAKSFIKVLRTLTRAEVGTREAMQLAIDLAAKSNEHATVFLDIFKRLFLRKYLDLDLATSVRLAKSLTVDYEGSAKNASKDFGRIVKFCLNQKKVGLSIPQCANTASHAAAAGKHWEDGVSSSMVKAYKFLKKKVGMTVGEALETAVEIIKEGPNSVDNFTSAYKYGVSQSGLSLSAIDALKFAKKMTKKTSRNSKKPANQE